MKNLTWRKILNRRGVSPIIGMVLISAVLFSVLALFFIWRASQEEFQLQRERERIQQLKLVEGESIEFLTIPPENLSTQFITIYNNGTTRPDIKHVYVNGLEISSFTVTWDATNSRIGYITINEDTDDMTESLKVESQLGNLYFYQMPSAVIDLLSWNDVGEEVILLLDGSKSNSVGGMIVKWRWEFYIGTTTTPAFTEDGARVSANLEKVGSDRTWKIVLRVTDSTVPGATDCDESGNPCRQGISVMWLTTPPTTGPGGEEGEPGFGGEGAPGGIYISLGGTGGGASVAEGRTITFNIKNFSGRMIPLTALRFYGVKSPSNYKCNKIYVAPVGKTLDAADIYYQGADVPDGGIAKFSKPYFLGDEDEAHVELTATGGGMPGDGDVFMIILYDAATPQSYYTVTVPIRTEDSTDIVVFNPSNVFAVTASDTLQGKSLDLNNKTLVSIGVAFSKIPGTEVPCNDRLLKFQVAGETKWEGSISSGSTIEFSPALQWDGEKTTRFVFNFTDVTQRFYYFVYRFSDGTSVAHKVPRFKLYLTDTANYPATQTVNRAGGTATYKFVIERIDQLETPLDIVISGLPCCCTLTLTPAPPMNMAATPITVTLVITVLPSDTTCSGVAPWMPYGSFPIVITGNNNLLAYSAVIYLKIV